MTSAARVARGRRAPCSNAAGVRRARRAAQGAPPKVPLAGSAEEAARLGAALTRDCGKGSIAEGERYLSRAVALAASPAGAAAESASVSVHARAALISNLAAQEKAMDAAQLLCAALLSEAADHEMVGASEDARDALRLAISDTLDALDAAVKGAGATAVLADKARQRLQDVASQAAQRRRVVYMSAAVR